MATLFVRPVAGNDASAGTSFATAKKTIPAASTVSAAGDTIKVEKSTDPTSIGNATWTDNTATIVLASALTANIERCEAAWTASANVTSTVSSTNAREGTNCMQLAFAAGFTTGLAAYKALGSAIDFSAYQQVSLWIKTTVALAAGDVTLRLCSDAAGVTTVNTITLPAIPVGATATYWQEVTVDTGGALGASIQSVAVRTATDFGAASVFFDNILACKASSSADALTLFSRVGKFTAGEPNWYGVRSINDTTVTLERASNSVNNRNYSGTTETCTTYKAESWDILAPTALATVIYALTVPGTSAAPILVSGGWDPADSMVTQNGHSFFSAHNGHGNVFDQGGRVFVNWEKVGAFRSRATFASPTTINSGVTYTSCFGGSHGVGFFASVGNLAYASLVSCRSWGSTGDMVSSSNCGEVTVTSCIFGGSGSNALLASSGPAKVYSSQLRSNASHFQSIGPTIAAYDTTLTLATQTVDLTQGGRITLVRCPTSDTAAVTAAAVFRGQYLYCQNYNNVAGDHRIFTDGGIGVSDTSTVHTTGIPSYKLSPTSANRDVYYPLRWQIAALADCPANQQRTISCWMRRSNSGITPSLVLKGGQIAGVASDVSVSCTAAADTWQLCSITFTPTEQAMLGDLEFQAYGGTAHNAWITEIMVT